jgi:CRP/FNR family transcriptional regulator
MALHAAETRDSQTAAGRPSNAYNPCQACAVRQAGMCESLEPQELERLSAMAGRTRLAAEQVVFCEGDPADTVFAVTEGTVRLSKMLLDGRRQITGFLSPGGFLGIAYSDTYAYSAEAVTALTLCRFPRRKLEALIVEMPGLERRLLSMASNELKAAQDQMLLLGRKSAEEKLATFLWKWCLRAGRRDRSDCIVDLPMSRTDIADYIGLTTETVSRTFSRFAKEGILALPTTHDVVLRRPERLEEMASGDL